MHEYLGLEGGPPDVQTELHVFRPTRVSICLIFAYGAVTRYGRPFQIVLLIELPGTGLVRVRSPLLTESRLMSFPPGTEMFQFPGFASSKLCIHFEISFII